MRIVIVEDEKLQLDRLYKCVTEVTNNCEILPFRSPVTALEYIKNNQIDVLFTDIEMPRMKGIEFAKKVKLIHPKTNIIFCTGYGEYALEAVTMPISGFLLKPVSNADVERSLQELRYPVLSTHTNKLFIQCFGNFQVYYDGKPIAFKYDKTLEFLAYLVDRKGAFCTNGEIMSTLFLDDVKSDYLRHIRKDLVDTLCGLGEDSIILKSYGKTALNIKKVSCDYYDWLDEKPKGIQAYFGEYMSQYSWAEETNSWIYQKEREY